MGKNKYQGRIERKRRVRAKISGEKSRPRVSVFRSNQALYVQFIDDSDRVTLLGKSELAVKLTEKNKVVRAKLFGKLLAEEAQKKKITTVVFDRSGYAYHGQVKALAEGLREGGLKF